MCLGEEERKASLPLRSLYTNELFGASPSSSLVYRLTISYNTQLSVCLSLHLSIPILSLRLHLQSTTCLQQISWSSASLSLPLSLRSSCLRSLLFASLKSVLSSSSSSSHSFLMLLLISNLMFLCLSFFSLSLSLALTLSLFSLVHFLLSPLGIHYALLTVPDEPSVMRQLGAKVRVLLQVFSSLAFRQAIVFCNDLES